MEVSSWFLILLGIITNVVSVLAIFVWLGWKIGAVEAVALSILVGTSVDYLLHLVEAYLGAGAPSKAETAAARAAKHGVFCSSAREYWADAWDALVRCSSLSINQAALATRCMGRACMVLFPLYQPSRPSSQMACTVRAFRQKLALEDAVGSQASKRVTNCIPVGCSHSYWLTLYIRFNH
jgi:hypothetical protein